jgi:adenosylcobinamide-GDP ribazoletransferase
VRRGPGDLAVSTDPDLPPEASDGSAAGGIRPHHRPGAARGGVLDGIRLALGTLTVLPVPPPRVVDRGSGAWAMTLAPLAGVLLAMPPVILLLLLAPSSFDAVPAVGATPFGVGPLLAAGLALAALAAGTRAMHLDGLADTADGLGSGKPPGAALEVMRHGDVGPFAVVTLLLTLLVEAAALTELVASGAGPAALTIALVVSRLALSLLCSRGIPAARPDGLGRAVAGSVSRPLALLAVLLSVAAVGLVLLVPGLAVDGEQVLRVAAVAPCALLAGAAVAWRCVRRLGGVTGDVMGAVVEVTFAACLVGQAVVA